MSGQSKFLPESVSGALRGLCAKLCGFVVLVFAVWSIVALFFHDPYLDGIAAAGNFGTQSLMGNFVGLFRYVIGYIPTLFLFLCLARYGLNLMTGVVHDGTPEYDILRGFVAICLGAAGFGLIAPRTTYGGMLGAVASADITNMIGTSAIFIGVLCLCGFFMIAGILLHISFADVMRVVRNVISAVRWVLTAFHLIQPVAEEDESDAEEEDEEEEEPEEEEKPKPRRKNVRKRVVSKSAEVIEYELPDPEFLEKSNFGKSVVTPELKQNARAMEIHFAEYV